MTTPGWSLTRAPRVHSAQTIEPGWSQPSSPTTAPRPTKTPDWRWVRPPTLAPDSTTHRGPTVAEAATRASGATTAEGWIPGAGFGHRACSILEQRRARATEGFSTNMWTWLAPGDPS